MRLRNCALYAFVVFILHMFCVGQQSSDVWSAPAFSSDPAALREAASALPGSKEDEATVLLNEMRFEFDAAGRMTEVRHLIYRIENEEGVKEWDEVSANWSPWHQAKPEIRARVIGPDGAVHDLDPNTLNDVPVHEDEPNIYSDDRSLGGPLPGVAVGSIVEEQETVRDTGVFFTGGTVARRGLAWSVPTKKWHIVLSHPEVVPVRYSLRKLPDATISKNTSNGIETIVIEHGPSEAAIDRVKNVPSDVLVYPDLEFTTGTTWQRVAAAYARIVDDKMRVADVQAVVGNLKMNGQTDRATAIRQIVSALHKNIRYTGVEFGESSLIPQFPSETLKRRYGDCKDKALLLAAMLRAAGIPATLSLLSTGPGLDVDPDLPGMGEFDHAIVYVPGSGTEPEQWIDATANYTRVGDLPAMDYGRLTLVVDSGTTALKKIPSFTSGQNHHIETREVTLAEYGPARFVERNEQIGPMESEYREFWTGDQKELRTKSEGYVKDAYAAEALTSVQPGTPDDLNKPFTVTYTVDKGRRGFTGLNTAEVYIPTRDLFQGLPEYFSTAEKKDDSPDAKKPRTVDWEFYPFVNEWRYIIKPPLGFVARALPPNQDEALASARYVCKYSLNPDGSVEVLFRFDSGKARLTADQGRELRDAMLGVLKEDIPSVTFDQQGYKFLSEGKPREALAAYRNLTNTHPKEALHKVQIARAYLTVGLGENAREEARGATLLEPASAQAFGTLGWILEHDEIGRRFGKGADLPGAVTAYRKAKQLDPKDKEVRANLAILLEFDDHGNRYKDPGHLQQAVRELKELKQLDEDYEKDYEDSLLFDLWYANDPRALLQYADGLRSTETRKALVLAATAAAENAQAAIDRSAAISSDNEMRTRILHAAGQLLMRTARYAEAADLLTAGARGRDDEAQVTSLATLLRKTHRRDDLVIDANDPRSAIQRLFLFLFNPSSKYEQFLDLTSHNTQRGLDPKAEEQSLQRAIYSMNSGEVGGVEAGLIADLTLSNTQFSLEGDDTLGYRMTVTTPGAQPKHAFVVKESGRYRILDFPLTNHTPENLGWEAIGRLEAGDVSGARKWLDWARDEVHMTGGDDPLSGNPFPHFWTKGQEGDAAAIRTAALVLAPSKEVTGSYLAQLVEARDAAKTDSERNRLNLVLAYAYSAQQKWPELLEASQSLMQAVPDSALAYGFAARAYGMLGRFDEWSGVLTARLQKHPDELAYIRSAAVLARYRGDFKKSRELTKTLMDQGRADANDLNRYAWDSLFLASGPDQSAVEAVERAAELTKQNDFNILHTEACVLAVTGKESQSRALLLKAMQVASMPEPNSSIWFGLGQLAEAYGEFGAAQVLYSRVEKLETPYPTDAYILAQQRLAALKSPATTSAKSRK